MPVTGIAEAHWLEACRQGKEASIVSLLQQGDISSERTTSCSRFPAYRC
ncbi:MAG: hypothetical protein GDA43_11185 [Hormoscilla sp. SP5CHS1]|nr:hypothetical protein [Hormoscilla sp. SP12CHS1]MBC6453698.1 hypothetical protein [Hormoscilla sp. SP5CHS1]